MMPEGEALGVEEREPRCRVVGKTALGLQSRSVGR